MVVGAAAATPELTVERDEFELAPQLFGSVPNLFDAAALTWLDYLVLVQQKYRRPRRVDQLLDLRPSSSVDGASKPIRGRLANTMRLITNLQVVGLGVDEVVVVGEELLHARRSRARNLAQRLGERRRPRCMHGRTPLPIELTEQAECDHRLARPRPADDHDDTLGIRLCGVLDCPQHLGVRDLLLVEQHELLTSLNLVSGERHQLLTRTHRRAQ